MSAQAWSRRLLAALHRVFDRDAHQVPALRVRHVSWCAWQVANGILTLEEANGYQHLLPLEGLTIAQVAAQIEALPGFDVPAVHADLGARSALILIDGAGRQDETNGDAIPGYTSLLWALLHALGLGLAGAAEDVPLAVDQVHFDRAAEDWLDLHGSYYGVLRLLDEMDDVYLARIISEILLPRSNNIAIAAVLETLFQTPAGAVSVTDAPLLTYDPALPSGHTQGYGEFDVDLTAFPIRNIEAADFYAAVDAFKAAGTRLRHATLAWKFEQRPVHVAAGMTHPLVMGLPFLEMPEPNFGAARPHQIAAALTRPVEVEDWLFEQTPEGSGAMPGRIAATLLRPVQIVEWIDSTSWPSSAGKPGDGLGVGVTWHMAGSQGYSYLPDALLDEIVATGDLCAFRFPPSGTWPDLSPATYAALIARLRALRPGLPILTYTVLTTVIEGSVAVGEQWLQGITSHPEWIIYQSKDANGKWRWRPDFSIPACRDWIVAQVTAGWAATGGDGVFSDLAARRPSWLSGSRADAYAAGYDDLMDRLRANLGLLYLNGVWANSAGFDFADQSEAVTHASGAMIEYFGLVPPDEGETTTPDWDLDIAAYWPVWENHAGTHFLVYGRHSWDAGNFPWDLETWGRYLYACYLMAAGANTSFKYHSTFQLPTTAGLVGGDYLLPELRRSLGAPSEERRNLGTTWVRQFSSGFAALNRHDAPGPVQVDLPGALYALDGTPASSPLTLVPGAGAILFTTPN